jgi:serine/threonine protein kinase
MPLGLQTAQLNFELNKEIGEAGKNSQVFLASDLQLSSEIVIKKIRKGTLTYEDDFYKEAKILYNNEHPNIAKVNYGCEDNDYVYIAMPYYKNGSLKDLISKRFLSVREIIRYSIQFLSGLNHIHSKKLIHFDIKPDNIFITDSDEAILADFGLAKAMNKYDLANQEFVYTRQVPPEAYSLNEHSNKFDIYLVGMTLYKLCNGYVGLEGQFNNFKDDGDFMNAVLNGTYPDKTAFPFHIPLKLTKLISRCLDLDPSQRPNSLEIINELGSIDSTLDWQYQKIDAVTKWILETNDKIISIEMSNNGNDFDVKTYKLIKASGNTTKIGLYCSAKIISKDIKKYILKALKDLS